MADVCLICRDKRLERGLTLALEDMGLSVGDREPTGVVILEVGAVPAAEISTGIPVILIGRQEPTDLHGATFLHRPVDTRILEQTVRECLTASAHDRGLLVETTPVSCPPLSLTPTEQGLYTALLAADGEPVPRETLLRFLPYGGGDGLLAVHICSLRRKLAASDAGRIVAVRGVGYRLYPASPCL